MSGGADVVCAGWLRKSPPEKKLRRYAWKRRWFVLRSGRLTGDPDVLEYYKHDHARKPIRIINMSLCEQVDAGLTFNKKDLDSSYVFDVRTVERVFYLVADSEEDMNTWVRCICDLTVSLPDPPSFPDPTSLVSLPPHSFPGGGVGDPTSQDPNYVTMTPCPGELPSLGRQVPPPAHLGFRSSPHNPHTRPSRRHTTGGGVGDTQPPPIHRNLKPRKVKPTPLDITPLQEWEELPAPVRSPVTRTFTRDCYTCSSDRPSTCQSSASSSDSDDPDDNYVAMTTSNIALAATLRGDNPMVLRRPRGDKQVEYLDLDLHTGRVATPPRQRARDREGERARERVDYVVVDPERTRALKSTREAWHDGRQSTEKDK
uniref:PH domain-containing protein n=1 Tax=Oncorhynchus tshawytscha TaxID=74940 RepID=A0AAZ3PN27_ONCTS